MPVKTIVIAGGALAGWMAASVLSRRISRQFTDIIVIDDGATDDSLGPAVPALASLPSARHFHAQFGYDEDAIINATGGGFSLGTAISGWTQSGKAIFHPFGDTGASMGHVSFHHLAARLRAEGVSINLADYALAALCAQTNRFVRPLPDNSSVLSTLDYGLLLDTARYCEMFKRDALANGVTAVDGAILRAEIDADGLVTSVATNAGPIAADLFLDCTGSSASIIGALPGVVFQDWSHWLPCDRLTSTSFTSQEPPLPYAHLAAQDAGWGLFLSNMGMQYEMTVSHGTLTSDQSADRTFYRSGRRSTLWQGNVVALGAAAAVIDPLSPLSLHILQSAIQHLLALLPATKSSMVEAAHFNEVMSAELDCARDFAIMPYKLNGRIGAPFWDGCRAIAVPDTLTHKIELYRATGRISLHDGEIMTEADWVACFDAQGIFPARYDPAANAISVDQIQQHFDRIRQVMLGEVRQMPFHMAYLQSIAQ